jgi:hypothetical protein
MCFKDLAARELELKIAGSAARAIRMGAEKAGHTNIDFLSPGMMRTLFWPALTPGFSIGKYVAQIHILRHLDLDERSRSRDPRPRSASTLARSTLGMEQIEVQTIFIDVRGYQQMLFNIPSQDLMAYHFPDGCTATISKLRFPLDDLRRSDFPFGKYLNDWSHFGVPIRAAA